jgi:hypothetical protein
LKTRNNAQSEITDAMKRKRFAFACYGIVAIGRVRVFPGETRRFDIIQLSIELDEWRCCGERCRIAGAAAGKRYRRTTGAAAAGELTSTTRMDEITTHM